MSFLIFAALFNSFFLHFCILCWDNFHFFFIVTKAHQVSSAHLIPSYWAPAQNFHLFTVIFKITDNLFKAQYKREIEPKKKLKKYTEKNINRNSNEKKLFKLYLKKESTFLLSSFLWCCFCLCWVLWLKYSMRINVTLSYNKSCVYTQ